MGLPHLLFVTGKLAEPSLRRQLEDLAPRAGIAWSVAVLPITVVALAPTAWIARHLTVPEGIDRIILPGLCPGDLEPVQQATGVPVERGPADLRDLPDHFRTSRTIPPGWGEHSIAILAEINHAPRLPRADLLSQAKAYQRDGADLIDLGCDPGSTWTSVGDAVKALRDEGLRVSIDSFDTVEVGAAVRAGAELVLSVNAGNRAAARDWGCEVVVLPDSPGTLTGLDETIELLSTWKIPFRVDPILEPIGFGFAASLGRYLEVRQKYPELQMLMGVGNLTELTEVDSAGVNLMLLGFCQEAGIRSVLTTAVINWARSSVRELDLARRLVHHSVTQKVLPKHLTHDLVLLRDPRLHTHGATTLRELATRITDRNFRLFAERGLIHVLSGAMHLEGRDPFLLFAEMCRREEIDAAHAFYLGYEMAKAVTALTLGKNYVQDQALRWGFLTEAEQSHRLKGRKETP